MFIIENENFNRYTLVEKYLQASLLLILVRIKLFRELKCELMSNTL